jgi:hypothetical protein
VDLLKGNILLSGSHSKEQTMPPTKPYSEYKVGEVAQANYKFFEDCFDPGNKPFRDWFFDGATTEPQVRARLKAYGLDIPEGIKLVVVDLQYARMKNWSLKKPEEEPFYEFILPPVPTRSTNADYVESQQWEEAWFHAIVDGYGM